MVRRHHDRRGRRSEPVAAVEQIRRQAPGQTQTRELPCCVFESRCSGVFATYQQYYGLHELSPVRLPRLKAWGRAWWAWSWKPWRGRWRRSWVAVPRRAHDAESQLQLGALTLALRPPGGGVAATERLACTSSRAPNAARRSGLAKVWEQLVAFGGRPVHAPGPDAFAGATTPGIARRLGRLRAAAPLGQLAWTRVLERARRPARHHRAVASRRVRRQPVAGGRCGQRSRRLSPGLSKALRCGAHGTAAALKALSATAQ